LPVLPTSLARWFLFVHDDAKPFATAEAQFIVKGIFSLSGVLDVVAFKVARSGLLLFPSSDNPDETSSVASGNSHPTPEVSLHDDVKSTNSVDNAKPTVPSWRFRRKFTSLVEHGY
jgi:hypothetical protein